MTIKKLRPYIWFVTASAALLSACYVASQHPRFTCNRCRTSIALLRDGYRSWGVYYCHGFQPQVNGGEKHFYHWPKFYRTDIRGLVDKEDK